MSVCVYVRLCLRIVILALIDFFLFLVDSDEDITTFDPYAPAESSPQSQSKAAFGVNPADISDCLDNTTNSDKSRQKNGYGVENIELRRSREVIVKSRVDSAMTSLPHDKQMVSDSTNVL